MMKPTPFITGERWREHLLVDVDGVPRPLAAVMDPWQRRDFEQLDPGWDRAMGIEVEAAKMRAYLERPRGHSKTTDIAVSVTRALYSAPRPIMGVVAAADKDQAALCLTAIETLTHLNKPLRTVLEIQNHRVLNRMTGSELVVMSSDADSSYGILPSFVVADELTHWGDGGEKLWESLFSSAAKRASCMLTVISNAGRGRGTSWQWKVKEAVRSDPRWYFSRLDGPVASWITPENLAEQRALLPPSAFARLWQNQWTDDSGDMLTSAMIEDAIDDKLRPTVKTGPGWSFFGGCDLAVTRDHSALVIVGFNPNERRPYRLFSRQTWVPPVGGEIDLSSVFLAIEQAHYDYCPLVMGIDPWEARTEIQRMQKRGLETFPVPFTGNTVPNRMAMILLQIFSERLFSMPVDERLSSELARLSIVPNRFGVKLSAPRSGRDGHCDAAMALAIALYVANEFAGEYHEVDDGTIDVVGTILGPNYLD